MLKMKQYISYIRVSTKSQGDSGLGLKAQERDINIYLDNYAQEPYEVIAEFCDVASGTKADRPQMQEALDLVRKTGATLLVSKLDRLSRKVSFISKLMEDKKVDFKVAQFPNADKFMMHIYSALAEQERDFISTRTKAALAAAKARGVILGGARPEAEARHRAVIKLANENAKRVKPIIEDSRKLGKSLRDIAKVLNDLGVTTARGGRWHQSTVHNYERRVQLQPIHSVNVVNSL